MADKHCPIFLVELPPRVLWLSRGKPPGTSDGALSRDPFQEVARKTVERRCLSRVRENFDPDLFATRQMSEHTIIIAHLMCFCQATTRENLGIFAQELLESQNPSHVSGKFGDIWQL